MMLCSADTGIAVMAQGEVNRNLIQVYAEDEETPSWDITDDEIFETELKVGESLKLKASVYNPHNVPLTYQWYVCEKDLFAFEGSKIQGATGPEYTVRQKDGMTRTYHCIVTDGKVKRYSKTFLVEGNCETTKISKVPTNIKLTVGGKKTLSPVIAPKNTTDKVMYSSSNTKVATVSEKGVITAKKAGTTTITVKSGKKSVKTKVTVTQKKVTGISGVPGSKTLKKGKSFTIKAKVTPSGASGKLTYRTANKKVATVDAKGKVTANKKGTAVITVTVGKIKKTCKITVK